jgi:hypothetical protein
MKQHRNPILKGVASRVRQLLEQYEESKVIQHDTTKGSLREAYLKQFLAEFVPYPFMLRSGFVTDCRGQTISPQIDLLVFDKTSIPGFALNEFVTIVPLETVRLAIEVKSVLRASDIAQIKRQQEAIRGMRVALTTPDRKYLKTVDCLGISQIVFAFDSECSHQTLCDWFRDVEALEAVCVVGKFILMRDPNTGQVESVKSDTEQGEMLHFVSKVYTTVLGSHREYRALSNPTTSNGNLPWEPDFGAYLTFDVPYPDQG